jgi:glucose-6-phosphate isomerase
MTKKIINVDITKLPEQFAAAVDDMLPRAAEANELLHTGGGKGDDFLGWVALPSSFPRAEIERMEDTALRLRTLAEVVIVIGIGGSYLGAKAVLEALSDPFDTLKREPAMPRVVFAGNNLSEDYMWNLLDAVRERSIAAIVISKSGTTTEPAIAFRIIKEEIERRYGKEGAAKRIAAVTDRARGALKGVADKEGYDTFVIPDDVGGRFSVLTPVGLLPLAVAGIDITTLMRGASDMERLTGTNTPAVKNPAIIYASARNMLYANKFKIEILASYEPALQYVSEWWKQLYGESEGKEHKGIFPASVTLTADLHSMGQYIQEGERTLFETVISVENSAHEVVIGREAEDADGLNFIAGKRLGEVNRMAELGVRMAHIDGGVPNLRITMPRIDEHSLGALLYFFEKACGISGYLLGVNPFDQPGVEAYKKNMFALLDKPGYETESAAIRKRL